MERGRGVVARDRLVRQLDRAVRHRLTLVIADPGFGKSELLAQWESRFDRSSAALVHPRGRDVGGIASGLVNALRDAAPHDAARLALVVGARPTTTEQDRTDALAGMLCAVLQGLPELDIVLVLDDAHLLSESANRLIEALIRQSPGTLHVLLLSRHELPFAVDRLADPVQRLTGTDLGFDDDELDQLLTNVAGDAEHRDALRALVGGWPAAARLAAEKIAQVAPDLRAPELLRLKTRGARDLVGLAQDVIGRESADTRRLAQVVAPYDGFTAELAEALGCTGAQETIAALVRRGMVVPLGFDRFQFYAFPRLLRDFVRLNLPMSSHERPDLVRTAGEWFEENGQIEGALRCAIDQNDSEWAARLLRVGGRSLIDHGRDGRVAAGLAVINDADRDATIDEVEGALHDSRGDYDEALRWYGRAAERVGAVSPWLAYRMGFLHYVRSELDLAYAAFGSAGPEEGSADWALLSAWRATVHWARNEIEPAQELAGPALDVAERLDAPRALAAAHTVKAMLCGHTGDRPGSSFHYDRALENAERAGDVLQVVRIRNNRGVRALEEGDIDLALPDLDAAIELAEASGLRFFLSLALSSRGELRFHQGQYDAAVADLERSCELVRTADIMSSAQVFLAHVFRHRGYAHAARVAYEEVLEFGRATGDMTLVVPGLCGLAQLLADSEIDLARELSQEALQHDAGVSTVTVLATAAWVALADNRGADAYRWAARARAEAVQRRDRLGEAEALHLLAISDPQQPHGDPRLREAEELLTAIGAPVWRARVRLERARRLPVAEALAIVDEVRQLAAQLGARDLADKAATLGRVLQSSEGSPQVQLLTLGGFRVRRAGASLTLSDWVDDSSTALLKRLTSSPSLTWTRQALQRSLWPGSPPEEQEQLLRTTMANVRRSLDPEGLLGEEQFLVARGAQVTLQGVEVDVHAFLAESAAGLDRGDRELLRTAEARYSGDYLEEHPGDEWAAQLREEARSRYVAVARALAAAAVHAEDFDAAARYSRRILERDPYDEGAHLSLVAALARSGQSAEARSCYATYVARLEELGLEAGPFGDVVESAAVA